MTLLNGILALGSLAVSIPLVIHLLNRRRFVTVDWGAMHLLESVVRVNRRRIQWVHLLLLLVRCAIPVLLAFCLARPVLTGFRALPGDAPRSLILVVDDSRSMGAGDGEGETRAGRLRDGLADWLGTLSRRDEVMLIPTSRLESLPGRMGAAEAVQQLRDLTPASGPFILEDALDAALVAVKEASYPRRHIVIASDFQATSVDDATMESLDRLRDRLAGTQPTPSLSFWNVGTETPPPNISVDAIEADSPAVVAGRESRWSCRIRNSGDAPASDLRLSWVIDGHEVQSAAVSVPPRAATVAAATHRFDGPGVHELQVAVEVADALPQDNRRHFAAEVIRQIDVLLVDGDPSDRPLESETDFLSIALSPFAFSGQTRSDAVRVQVCGRREMTARIRDRSFDVVVLANVAAPDRGAEAAVVEFVHGGGSLVIFDGDQVSPDAYNRRWASGDVEFMLPAGLGRRAGGPLPENDAPRRPGEVNPQFSPWRRLADDNRRLLDPVEVFSYRELDPAQAERPERRQPAASSAPEGAESAVRTSAPSVLLELAGGEPIVVAARRGRGRIVQFAIPCDADWSTFPLRPAFLPMMQQLAMHLARSRTDANCEVGTPMTIPLDEFAGPVDDGAEVTYTVAPPGGGESILPPTGGSSPRLVFTDTGLPGGYRFRRLVEPRKESTEPPVTLRVAEVDPVESNLRGVAPERLEAVAESVGGTIYDEFEPLRSDERTRRFGREIWRLLLVALVAAMIGEVAIQQTMLRRATGASRG